MKRLILLTGLFIFTQKALSQIAYTWNGSVSSAWTLPVNWSPAGIPTSGDNVTIVTGSNNCVISLNTSVNNLIVTSGTLNLGGFTLTANGPTATFTAGTILNGTLTVSGASTASFGTGPFTMNCILNITSAAITIKNTTCQNSVAITKTGATNDVSNGNNIFNGPVSITNAGSGYLMMGNSNADRFNASATFNNTGSGSMYLAHNSSNNIFGAVTTFNNTPVSNSGIYISQYAAGTTFNDNIIVTSTLGQGVQFCNGNTTANATLAATKTITVGSGGFSAGTLLLRQFIQTGTTAQNLTLTGTSVLTYGPSSSFGADITSSSPGLYFNGCTFAGAATITKTGSTGEFGNGGNTFNGITSITNSGSGFLVLGNTNPDIWNNDVTFTDNGSERLLPCWSAAGNQFNGNITVNTAGSAQGIQFCGGNTTATAMLVAGKTIQAGSTGLTAGFLILKQFTQGGTTPINIISTGSSSVYLGPSSNFGGAVTITAPDLFAQGATYNSTTSFTKTGSGYDASTGGNIFQGSAVVNNSGAGNMTFGNNASDKWNSDVTFNSTGSAYIGLGWNSTGNLFNGNITVTSTGSSTGILFCSNGGASATLAAGMTVQAGSGGFSSGSLLLKQFTQSGSSPISLAFTGSTTLVQVGPSSAIGGNFTVTSPRILMNGGVFTGTVSLTKTGATGEWSTGGNTFNSTLTVNQQGAGYFGFANGTADIYNGDVYANNNSTERIIFGNNPTGNQFNGNIILTQVGSSQGIAFGWSANTNETMAAGKTISIGAAGFSTGYLQIEQFTQQGNTPMNLSLTGTSSLVFGPASAIGGNMVSTSGALFFNGCTFSGTVDATKNGSTNDNSSGNNVFNGVTNITNAGTGNLLFANGIGDQFTTSANFNNSGSGNLYVAYNSSNNIFGGVTSFNNSPSANTLIYVSSLSAGTTFNNNIIVMSTSGQGVQFCTGNTTATATLSAGKTIGIGAAGFSAGTLLLKQFTQSGATAQSLTLTGTGILTYGPSAAFGGNITSSSPTLYLNGCTFNGTANITKTGSTGDYSIGGNLFNGVSTITNSGSSYLLMGNTNPDIWNNDVTFTDNGSERLLPCWATAGNQFNGNIYVNTAGSAQGIQFCGGNATATATVAAGKTIQSGTTGLTAGYLILKQFIQSGNTAINLTLSSTATYLQFGPLSSVGGDVVSTSPGLLFNGCTFSGMVNSTKTGATNDASTGHNIFNGASTLTNAGAGYLMLGSGNQDQFNSTANFNNTGSSNIYVAYNSANNIFGGVTTFNNAPTAATTIYVSSNSTGTVFNDNIIVTSTSGQGVQFCAGSAGATATLLSGKTINVGAGGFSAGTLLLRQFIQSGATPQNITLTGSGNLSFGPSSAFGGNVTTVSPTIFFNGCNFSGTVTATKNGSTSDASTGNNTFNGAFTVTNTGAGFFLMGNGNPDTWQSTAVFNNYSTGQHMYTAYNSTGNVFNGDVLFNNQPTANNLWIYPNLNGASTQFNGNISVVNVNGGGVYFGSGTGNAVLASGKTIAAGAGGFNYGGLILRSFTQTGAGTVQTISTTGTSYIQYGPAASFDGPVTSTSPGLLFNGAVFNGTVNSAKTGTTNDQSQGGNTFNGQSTFSNNGTGYLMMTNVNPDAYNSNTTFVQSGSGAVYPNYNGNSNYAGNVTVSSPAASPVTFGSNTGTASFTGAGAQSISVTTGTATPVFTRLNIANTGSGVTLSNTSISVSKSLSMTSGLLNTSTGFLLTMLNGSVATAGTAQSTSYVNGPMRYQKSTAGSTVLNFPVGTSPDCRPVSLTVNHANGNLYTYQVQLFNASAAALNYTLPVTVDVVSSVHYYTITRVNAAGVTQPTLDLSGNQTIQVFFGSNDVVGNGNTLTIVKNVYTAPTKWIDIGGLAGPTSGGPTNLSGSITSTSTPSAFNSFSTFSLGDEMNGGNVLPIQLLYFTATADKGQVDLSWATSMESNNNYFTVERSQDAVHFESIQQVNTEAVNGNSSVTLNYSTTDANPYAGLSYYRLKQTDLDGNATYAHIAPVDFAKTVTVSVYPNPTVGTIYIKGLDASAKSIEIDWYDLSGKNLLQQTIQVQSGMASLSAPFGNGMYILHFTTVDGQSSSQTIVIRK